MTIITSLSASEKPRRKIRCLVFDLDDTLYRTHEVGNQVRHGIHGFMTRHLGFPVHEVEAAATELYVTHGTTLAGLVAAGHKIDYDHWHREVHYELIEYEQHVLPDPALRELLFSIDLPKYVFTNADVKHAEICLDLLGISDCFQGMFHFESLAEDAAALGLSSQDKPVVICKPAAHAYNAVFKRIGVQPQEVIFFDDSLRNIRGAHELGVMTVLVGTDQPTAGADLCIPDLHHLPRVLPELIDQPGMVKEVPVGHEHEHMVTVGAPR